MLYADHPVLCWLLLSVPLCAHCVGHPFALMKGVKDMFITCLLRRQTVQEHLLMDSRPLVATKVSAENDRDLTGAQ